MKDENYVLILSYNILYLKNILPSMRYIKNTWSVHKCALICIKSSQKIETFMTFEDNKFFQYDKINNFYNIYTVINKFCAEKTFYGGK